MIPSLLQGIKKGSRCASLFDGFQARAKSTQRRQIDGAGNHQRVFPGPNFPVAKSALSGPCVSVVPYGDRVVRRNGQKLAIHLGVIPSEGRTNATSFLQTTEVDLDTVALERRWISFVQGIQLRQSVGQRPLKRGRRQCHRRPLRVKDQRVVHGRTPRPLEVHRICGARTGRLRIAFRYFNGSKEPFPPRFSGLGGILLGMSRRRAKARSKGEEKGNVPNVETEEFGIHVNKGIRPAGRVGQDRGNMCEAAQNPRNESLVTVTYARGTILNARCS